MSDGAVLVWYCQRCRAPVKVLPPTAILVRCRCATPIPTIEPTKVYW